MEWKMKDMSKCTTYCDANEKVEMEIECKESCKCDDGWGNVKMFMVEVMSTRDSHVGTHVRMFKLKFN